MIYGFETFPYGAQRLAEIPKLVFADDGGDEESVILIPVLTMREQKEQTEKEGEMTAECKTHFLFENG